MRKLLLITIVFLVLTLSMMRAAIAQTVNIPDPNLRAAIAEALGKNPGAAISQADMRALTIFISRDRGIQELTGLEFATKLAWVDLRNNQISDVSLLAGLTHLTRLHLGGNQISDVSLLAGLTNLRWLGLYNNQISDVSLLAGLTNLERLDLDNNQISNVSLLAGLTHLEELYLGGNQISDVSLLAGLTNLEYLYLSYNQISDVSPLAGLTNLTWLRFSYNQISDVSPLAGLTNLKILDLDNNQISDVSLLAGLTNLEHLNLVGNQISDVSLLAGLTNLEYLYLGGNQISDFSAIAGLIPNLTSYKNEDQRVADVNGDGFVNIQDLVFVASRLGQTGENPADVNGDGFVNIQDLVFVAGGLGGDAAAPAVWHQTSLGVPMRATVEAWLLEARRLSLTDARSQRGVLLLERFFAALVPEETALLTNYPNPFNPETWIPYHLAEPADVTVTIYAIDGTVVRRLALGHQAAGYYQRKSRAAYWDGRNSVGERVASGVYFYTLEAGDFTATKKLLIRK